MQDAIRQAIGSDEAWAAIRYPSQPWKFARTTGKGSSLLIQAFDRETAPLRLFECSALPIDGSALPKSPALHQIDQDSYQKKVADAVGEIRNGRLQKVVLSRIAFAPQDQANWASVLLALESAYSNAYVYVINLPKKGCWMGASPECLVKRVNGGFKTMALAGTRKREELDQAPWRNKELQEQDLVRQHIVDRATSIGAENIEVDGPVDSVAGNLVHLRSDIHFECESDSAEVTSALHPTPAVAGLPVEAALSAIRNLEDHPRSLYAGYMGWSDNEVGDELFVLLRCMRCWQDGAWLYVGGGITADSDPEAEWQETEDKAETLKSVLRMQ